ncbi:MAG: T9SS type A sorting domain-containing protein [Bacteroidia bacterium]|nr:T9SS type A sorting domain-containing protein [Bacteroidia bacterium]
MIKKIFLSISCLLTFGGFAQLGVPSISNISGPASVCSAPAAPKTYSTVGTGIITAYLWGVYPSQGVVMGSPNSSVTTISFPNTAFIYTITCYAFNSVGFSQVKTFIVAAFETPKVTFSGASIFCQGSSTNIQASPTTMAASSTISYTWNPPTGLNSPYVSSPIASPSVSTTYTITYAIGNCTNTAQLYAFVDICNGIKNIKQNENSMLLYPNPSNGEFFIKAEKNMAAFLFDNQGKLLRKITLTAGSEQAVTGLNPGIYYVVADNRRQKIIITP